MPKKNCYDTAIDILSRRDNAVAEMRSKLTQKQFEPEEITDVINRLLAKNFLNDANFAFSRARYRATLSGWGKTRIRQELMQKGVASDQIDTALTELEDTTGENHNFKTSASTVLSQRFQPLHTQFPSLDSAEIKAQYHKEVQRRMAFLLRRGFSITEAKAALNASDQIDVD